MSESLLKSFAEDIYGELADAGLEPSQAQCMQIASSLASMGYRCNP